MIMRYILLFIALFVNVNSFASNDPDITEIRVKFYQLAFDCADTEKILEEVRSIQNPSGIIVAYEAAMQALMAKVVWNPFTKVSHVKLAEKVFDKAVKLDPLNIEIRFIRFSVEYHIPKWLGLSKHMQEDKDFILENINSFDTSCVSQDMLSYISNFVKESGWYSSSELEKISAITGA